MLDTNIFSFIMRERPQVLLARLVNGAKMNPVKNIPAEITVLISIVKPGLQKLYSIMLYQINQPVLLR